MGDLGWNRGLGHTVNSPGHDGGAKPRQEFAGGAAQDGTRGAMALGAPVWARRVWPRRREKSGQAKEDYYG
jgi:hypothetical protein